MKNLIDLRGGNWCGSAISVCKGLPNGEVQGGCKKNPYFGGKKVPHIYGWQKRTRMFVL